jgi:hypothetical protein
MDQCSFFVLNEKLEVFTNLLIACRCLSNNEVQENNASNHEDENPNEPVNYILGLI